MSDYSNGDGVMNIGGAMGNVVAGRRNRQTVSGSVDVTLAPLAAELERLHQAAALAGSAHAEDASTIRQAADAAAAGDRSGLATALKRTTTWVLRLAETIGTSLVIQELGKLV